MHKIFKLYNQNRFWFWLGILVFIFIIFVIQTLNNGIEEKQKYNNSQEETVSNTVSSSNESKSIITNGNVPDRYSGEISKIIDNFFTYCINHEPKRAYDLLSDDIKELEYPNEKIFESLYYKDKFEGDKQYSFQSWWHGSNTEIYVVKIFDNMLSTGKSGNSNYIEDYICVVPDEDTFKINVNGFVGNRKINKSNNNELLTINVSDVQEYINYSVYTCEIKNNTNNKIILDTRKETDTTYLLNENGIKFNSFLYENKKEDFIIKPQEFKTIKIKFDVEYGKKISEMSFDDILIDGDEYNEQYQLIVGL